MELLYDTPLRMSLVLFILFVLVQSPRTSASSLLKHEEACGTYHINHVDDPNHELFYIDGKLVDRYFFCKALSYYQERNCFLTEIVRNQYCRLLGIMKLFLFYFFA